MATPLYLRNAASDLAGAGRKLLSPTRGAASTTLVTNTVAGGNDLQVTQTAGGQVLEWLSGPLNPVTISGAISVAIRGLESATAANAAAGILIQRASPSGAVLSTIVPITSIPAASNEYTTADTAKTATVTPTSTTLAGGDRLRIVLYVRAAAGVTMGGARTVTNSIDGPTAGAAGDTSASFAETLVAYSGAIATPATLVGTVSIPSPTMHVGAQRNPATILAAAQVPVPAQPLAAFVKTLGSALKSGTSNTTTLTLTQSVAAGNRLLVGWGGSFSDPADDNLACDDSKGNTYTLFRRVTDPTGAAAAGIFSAPIFNALAAGDTITVTQSTPSSHGWVFAEEWAGLSVPAQGGDGTGTGATASTSAAALAAGGSYFGMLTTSAAGHVTGTLGAPWTARGSGASTAGTPHDYGLWDRSQAQAASLTFGPSLSGTAIWAAAVVALTAGTEPPTPALVLSWVGGVTTTSVVVTAHTTLATSVRLVASTDPTLVAQAVAGAAQTPDANGYTRHTIAGLIPGTEYTWGLELNGVLTGFKGTFRTFPSRVTAGPDRYGIAWGAGQPTTGQWDAMDAAGVQWLRFDVDWLATETSKGTFSWTRIDGIVSAANARGIKLLALVSHVPGWANGGASDITPPISLADFADFCRALANRYVSQGMRHYELFNEPNITTFWAPTPNAGQYVALLQAGYRAIKAAQPTARVLSAGLAPGTDDGANIDPRTFLTAMYAAGSKGHYDAVGWHPYSTGDTTTGAATFAEWSNWSRMAATSPSARSIMAANGESHIPIWATEYGRYTGGSAVASTEAFQADDLVDAYTLWDGFTWTKAPWGNAPLFYYEWIDGNSADTTDPEQHFGLVHDDGSDKPARLRYTALATGSLSFSFAFGSCAQTIGQDSFARALARSPDLAIITGDFPYADVAVNDPNAIRSAREALWSIPGVWDLARKVATAYTWSDHDFGANNANGSSASKPAAQTVYRQQVPHYPMVVSDAIYQTFTRGRCRFVLTDNRSFKSVQTDPDTSAKTVLGTVQKQWLKDQIAAASEPIIFWVNEQPWTGPAGTGDDEWSNYDTERTELGNYIAATGKVVIIMAGDMHALAYHNGSGVPGRMPIMHAAPWANINSIKGGPYTLGPYPTSAVGNIFQYGYVDVTDAGAALSVRFRGFDSSDVVRIDATLTWMLPATIVGGVVMAAPGLPVHASVGAQTITGQVVMAEPDVQGTDPSTSPDTILGRLFMGEDREPPTVPEGLHADTILAASVDLSWQPSTDNVAVAGYELVIDGPI